tara:strand:+ start:7140 stop:9476 length:2337 start_codon:yes stop_codon:yes gene_type:complete
VLFNGKEAFEVGSQILKQAHEDNFFELLPVEPISLLGEDVNSPTIVPGFTRAEEKAVKSIQKHSMNIKGKQRNRKIDEAYLLLGKARYFDRRFFPALEAFNFLLESEADYKTFIEGRVWRERTNIRLNNNALAIQNLRSLALDLPSKNKFYALANATVGEAYLNLKEIDSALYYIKRAALSDRQKKQRARYLFLVAQLFEEKSILDSAQWAYSEVIDLKRKAPRNLFVNAKIRSQLYSKDSTEVVDNLLKMLDNYENEAYLHSIYRGLGQYHIKRGMHSMAINYYNESLRSPQIDTYTKIANYSDLADYMFDEGAYVAAGAYLDSILPLYDQKSLQAKRLLRRRDNLSEVLLFESQKKETDSLLRLVALSEQEQIVYFDSLLEQKKKEQLRAAQKQTQSSKTGFLKREKQAFYFYNPNLVIQGKQDFLARWGTRPNVDNWRTATDLKTVLIENQTEGEEQQVNPIEIITPEAMAAKVPRSEALIDSVRKVNRNAYLQLGLSYKEKFDEIKMANQHLQTFLERKPEDLKRQEALYHLFKLNEKVDQENANAYKEQLTLNYPESPYAKFLLDPENYDESELQTPERLYEKVYALFEAQQFKELLESIAIMEVMLSGSSAAPKVALLKANTIGRLQGIEAWKKELEEVANVYGTLEVGEHAKGLLAEIKATQNLSDRGPIYKNYKWIFPFQNKQKGQIQLLEKMLKDALQESPKKWSVSIDTYDEITTFLVVHGILDPNEIEDWLDSTDEKTVTLRERNYFVALSATYRDYQKNKTWKNNL